MLLNRADTTHLRNESGEIFEAMDGVTKHTQRCPLYCCLLMP